MTFQIHDNSLDWHIIDFPESHEATQRKGYFSLVFGNFRRYPNARYHTRHHGGALLRRRRDVIGVFL